MKDPADENDEDLEESISDAFNSSDVLYFIIKQDTSIEDKMRVEGLLEELNSQLIEAGMDAWNTEVVQSHKDLVNIGENEV
ncbi:MAG: hypothetical protein [Caudoviricetes sp.]|nr:MAG: hypothetical protein [Caudoviricetes sp.]